MENKLVVNVHSEIGKIEGVILHTPGAEIENMSPSNAQRALYSDILNLQVAQKEYAQFCGVMGMLTNVYQVKDLLADVLKMDKVKETLVHQVCNHENAANITDKLMETKSQELSRLLIEGVPLKKNTLTKYISPIGYALDPLHNFFFTRDASSSIYDKVLINKMASTIRDRESTIMETIFDYHPNFKTKTINPKKEALKSQSITVEGGDVLIAREDVLLIGMGMRTTSQGIDFIMEKYAQYPDLKHIVIQELPKSPESFIHLDMVFTFLDINKCMIYEPIILKNNSFRTIHLEIENGKAISISERENLIEALQILKFDIEPLFCGGKKNRTIQDREQWHSGANFFASAPGQVFGYARNVYTLEELDKSGFAVLEAKKILNGETNPSDYKKFVVTIQGSELARGGGGARCMTMPFRRQKVNW
ncbi:MAG: arginine deiminase [Bacteroidales bacterium]|nr:arginine deiminase [Bacteroidales bacterium]